MLCCPRSRTSSAAEPEEQHAQFACRGSFLTTVLFLIPRGITFGLFEVFLLVNVGVYHYKPPSLEPLLLHAINFCMLYFYFHLF